LEGYLQWRPAEVILRCEHEPSGMRFTGITCFAIRRFADSLPCLLPAHKHMLRVIIQLIGESLANVHIRACPAAQTSPKERVTVMAAQACPMGPVAASAARASLLERAAVSAAQMFPLAMAVVSEKA
jgi:hypothetical protein